MKCMKIDYFPAEEYSPDPNDSTMAIPYAVTRAAAFYFLSTLMLFCGELCLFTHFVRRKKVFAFASGCFFIMAGLVMLGGLVIYISTFKTEVGKKLQQQSSLQPVLFTYHYGFSFLLVVSGFLTSELAGTFAIFLYINLQNGGWSKKATERRLRALYPGTEEPPGGACRRHHRPRAACASEANHSRDNSPRSPVLGGRPRANSIATALPLSESMRDLSLYNFPPFARDNTCNTVSTSADLPREFSYETLRRTTPV